MARLIFLPFLILCMLLLAVPAQSARLTTHAYAEWRDGLTQDAIAAGIPPATAHAALDNIQPDDHVIELDQRQPETTQTVSQYLRHAVSSSRVAAGIEMMQRHGKLLAEISNRTTVPPEIILALWGMESEYGRNSGNYDVISSLVTLAYEGRRGEYFRGELINALRIIDQQHLPPSALIGSWAGAMGQCQFMPSTYLRYAIDYDGDGKADIWTSTPDILGSIANYIAAEGWQGGQPAGYAVRVPADFPTEDVGLDHKHSLTEWAAMGVKNVSGKPLPAGDQQVSLIQPDGPDGLSFIVYDNFRALMRWNRSTSFAIAVVLLADAIQS
jgi:membrane-bound lytic murein transglycosylase B